jgi:hypothetical protein
MLISCSWSPSLFSKTLSLSFKYANENNFDRAIVAMKYTRGKVSDRVTYFLLLLKRKNKSGKKPNRETGWNWRHCTIHLQNYFLLAHTIFLLHYTSVHYFFLRKNNERGLPPPPYGPCLYRDSTVTLTFRVVL